MDLFEIVMLALIQGLTEFLPISSSAHLILPSAILGWQDQGLAFDVAVHVGTLLAVMLYFRHELVEMSQGCLTSLGQSQWNQQSRLAAAVVIGVLPACFVGAIWGSWIEHALRSGWVIATTTVLFGLLLWWADRRPDHGFNMQDLSFKAALLIGIAQAFALIPGTSRSGVTITAALLLGYNRDTAARFSFLLSIPVILGAGLLKSLDLMETPQPVDWFALTAGTAIAFVSAYLCIHWFLVFLNRIGMMPFVIYRLILGVLLFMFLSLGG